MFLARTDEQKRFETALAELGTAAAENRPSPTLLVHGRGGMGKSELCKRFVEITEGELPSSKANAGKFIATRVDWQDERDNHATDYPALTGPQLQTALTALYDTLASDRAFEGKQMRKQLERAFAPYLRVAARLAQTRLPDAREEEVSDAKVLEPALLTTAQAAGAALGVQVPSEALGSVVSGVRAMRRSSGRADADEVALAQRPGELLVREFARGVRELSQLRPIVFILDTYELITGCGAWIRQAMRQTGERVLWVVAARLEQEEDAGRGGEIASFRRELPERSLVVVGISPFDHETILELLKGRGVATTDEATVDAVASLTHGVPLAVDLVSSLLLKDETMEEISKSVTDAGDATNIVRELTERYLRHALDDTDLRRDIPLLFGLALLYADRSDPDLISALWGDGVDVGSTLSGLAARHDFVLTGSRRLHQEVRETFQRYLLNEVERAEYGPNNRRAAALCLDRTESVVTDSSAIGQLSSKEWRDGVAAVIWHRFWADNGEGLELLCEVFPRAVLLRRSFAHELVGLASFFSETFTSEQSSLLRGLASLLSFGSFLDGWFAKRREAFHRDRTLVRGSRETTDRDRELAFKVLRRGSSSETLPHAGSPRLAAIELLIAKASAGNDPLAALTALERAAEAIPANDGDLAGETVLLARDLANRLARPPAGSEPSEAALRAADLVVRYEGDSPSTWLEVGYIHRSVGRLAESVGKFHDVVARFGDDQNPEVQHVVAGAMFAVATTLDRLGQPLEAIEAYKALVERYVETDDTSLRRSSSRALFNMAVTLAELGRDEEAIDVYDEMTQRFAKDSEMRGPVSKAMAAKALTLAEGERLDEALKAYDEILVRFADWDDQEAEINLASAFFGRAVVLTELKQFGEAIEAYDEAYERFKQTERHEIRMQAGNALLNKAVVLDRLGRHEEEIEVYDTVIADFGSFEELEMRRIVSAAFATKGLTLGELGRLEEANAVYDEIRKRFENDEDSEVRGHVAEGLINKAVALDRLGRHEEEIAVYDEIVERLGDDEDMRVLVAQAMGARGVTLEHLDRQPEALETYGEIVTRFERFDDEESRVNVAKALVAQGVVLCAMERYDDALATYNETIERFGDAELPMLRFSVASALLDMGMVHRKMDRLEAALESYTVAVGRLQADEYPEQPAQMARALFNRAYVLGELGGTAEEIGGYDELTERLAGYEESIARGYVAKGLFNKARRLSNAGDSAGEVAALEQIRELFGADDDEEMRGIVATALLSLSSHVAPKERIAIMDEVVEHVGESSDPSLRNYLSTALAQKARLLRELGDLAGEIAVYDDLAARFGKGPGVIDLVVAGRASLAKAEALAIEGDPQQAVALSREVATRFRDEGDLRLRGVAADALLRMVSILDDSGRPEEQISACDELIDRFCEDDDPVQQRRVAAALFSRAYALGEVEKPGEAVAGYQELIDRFVDSDEPPLRRQVAKALHNQAFVLGRSGKLEERMAVYDVLIERFGEDEDDELRSLVVGALQVRAFAAKQRGDATSLDRAEASYEQALRIAGEDPADLLGSYALFLTDSRKDQARAREMFERAFAADPERAADLGNFSRLLFEQGETARALELADRAFANLTAEEEPLRLELHFYLLALGPEKGRAAALTAVQELVKAGVQSPEWDLSRILERAAAEGHEDLPWLEVLASVISAEETPDRLDGWMSLASESPGT